MKVETDTILVSLSVILGLISTRFFVASGLFESPVTDSLFILTAGSLVLYITHRTGQSTVTKGGQLIFSITLLSSTVYMVTTFASGELLLSAIFGLFAVLFLGSAYLYTREESVVTGRRIMIFCVALLFIFTITAGVDIVSGEPNAQVDLDDNVTKIDDSGYGDYAIGTIEANNPSILPKTHDFPRNEFCITGVDEENRRDVPRPNIRAVNYEDSLDKVVTKESSRVIIRSPFSDLEGSKIVRSDECPESTDELTVHFLGQ